MFKHSNQAQDWLLPPSLEDSLREDHLARYIKMAVESIDTGDLESQYSEKGQNAYHPKMLLAVLLYGYAIGLRSSRKLAQACEENIAFMWICGRQTPDFRTIALFRKQRLKDVKGYFQQVLMVCMELGMAQCGKISLDGTKMRANANRHKVTYRTILERREEKLKQMIDDMFEEAEVIDREEDRLYGNGDGIHVGAAPDKEEIEKRLKELLKQRERLEKKQQKAAERMEQTKEELRILGEKRNTWGKTDPDSTHMRMKEDYPAPGYNVQFATEHQVILAYDIFPNCTDHALLPPMREEIRKMCGKYPLEIIADAGYGNQKTYKYLDEKKQKYTIPYQAWRKDRGKRKRGQYTTSNESDCWWERKKWEVWAHLRKKENRERLKQRGCDVEAVIGDLKENMGLRQFYLRGRPGVYTETGLASIAHNIKKMSKCIKWWREYMAERMAVMVFTS